MNKNRNRYTGEGGICGWEEKRCTRERGAAAFGKKGRLCWGRGSTGKEGMFPKGRRENFNWGRREVSTGEGGTAFLKSEGRYHRGRKGSCARDGSPAGTRDSCIEERETTASRKGQQL